MLLRRVAAYLLQDVERVVVRLDGGGCEADDGRGHGQRDPRLDLVVGDWVGMGRISAVSYRGAARFWW